MRSLFAPRAILTSSLAAIAALAALSCSSSSDPSPTSTPTSTPEATPQTTRPPEPSPTATLAPTTVPTDNLPTPTATSAPATPTPGSTPSPTPTSVSLDVTDTWEIDFPNSISFSIETESPLLVENVELRFNYPLAHTCESGFYNSVRIEPEDPNSVEASWDLEMEEQGSMPPGTRITYWWLVTTEGGAQFETSPREVLWEDTRFEWSEYTSGNVTFNWHNGSDSFGQTLAAAVENRLDRMEFGIDLDKPIQAYIYPDAAQLREAVLYTQAWTGGLAYTSQNILLIAVGPTAPASQVDGLVHELAHLLVREVTFSCIGDMPTWLDEGLAEYAEGEVDASEQAALDAAQAGGTLITLQSLSSSFPADHSGALLAYAQSKSIVTYLIEEHGWDKMNQLLDIFEQGSAYESALTEVYSLNFQSLDTAWRTWLAAQ